MIKNRNNAIEFHILDITKIPDVIIKKYDFQYSTKEKCNILWVHIFERDLFPYLEFISKVVNREALQKKLIFNDYLNFYVECDNTGIFGFENEEKKYKNIRFSEIQNYNLDNIYLKNEI